MRGKETSGYSTEHACALAGAFFHARHQSVSLQPVRYVYMTITTPASTDENVHTPAQSVNLNFTTEQAQELAAFFSGIALDVNGRNS